MTQQRLQLTWHNKDKALIPTKIGKYSYTWTEPNDPRYCETHTLLYDDYFYGSQSPKSNEFKYSRQADLEPQDDNLLILGDSGDVLEALTRVPELAKKYVGKVKLIYIDPPFNTAQTFASYEDNLEHSIWLTMMRDRLLNLKKVLANDGSIWVHLDDTEVHRMRLLMDEVFGTENFVAEVVWQRVASPKNSAKYLSDDNDFILVYARQKSLWQRNKLPRPSTMDTIYSNPDNDPRGPWTSGSFNANKPYSAGLYKITTPSGRIIPGPPAGTYWRYSEKALFEMDSDNRIWWGSTKDSSPRIKRFLSEVEGAMPRTLWLHSEVGHGQTASTEIKNLFPDESPFSTPKPERLLERIIHIGSNPGDIVLDAFAGSGTTAAVAQKMGRRWVTCELLESTFTKFTRPRLEKVVLDRDPGGITRTKGERIAADNVELPDGVSPDDAAKFTSVLNKLIASDSEAKKSAWAKRLKAAAKTKRTKEVVNWRGGGGFQVAHLSPACFDYEPTLDRVILTPEATGQVLIESVAANLGFTLLHADDDYVFDARRGNSLLKVSESVATIEQVDWLISQLAPNERIVLASTSVMDGVREHLRRACKGSRLITIPDDIFRYSQGGEL